jgi:molecular chaperone DnaJ
VSTKDWLEKDFYATLGVSKDASAEDIKKSYRKLARAHHPDNHPGDAKAEQKFKEISEAYSVLSSREKRKEYDEARSLFGSFSRGGPFRRPGTAGTASGNLGDLFGQGGNGGLGDIFGGLFGQGGTGNTRVRTTTAARRGSDVETDVTLDFSDAVAGTTIRLNLSSDAACPTCHGTGAKTGSLPKICPNCEGTGMEPVGRSGGFAITEPCKECLGRGLVVEDPCVTCHGSGRAQSTRTVQARIPAGVDDGQRIRLKGKGGPGENGGAAGDLYVRVHVGTHRVFGKKGANLTIEVPVTFAEAALGSDIKVPTLTGAPVNVRVPPGTPNGRVLRVRGKGARRSDGSYGDMLVTLKVIVPGELDEEQRQALAQYAKSTDGVDVRAKLLRDATSA